MLEFRIGNCRIQISCLFFAFCAFLLIVDQSGLAFLGLLASLAHELGHLCAMQRYRCTPCAICLGTFGMRIEYPPQTRIGYRAAASISFAGPAVNILTAGLLFYTTENMPAVAVHLVVGIFNLLPIEVLDGGECLRNLLLLHLPPDKVKRIVTVTSVVFIAAVTVLGAWVLYISGYNFSLLVLSGYLIFLLFLKKKD